MGWAREGTGIGGQDGLAANAGRGQSVLTLEAVVLAMGALGLAVALYTAPTASSLALILVGLGIPVLWLLWTRPELGVLGVAFLTSSIVSPDLMDVRLSFGGLDMRDLALLGTLAIACCKVLVRRERVAPWWGVSLPLIGFLIYAVFSVLYAVGYMGVESNWALGELRSLAFYATYFIVTWSLTENRQQFIVLLAGLFILADLTAGVIILQQFSGVGDRLLASMSPDGSWRVWSMGGSEAGFGAVRILPPGHVLTYAISIIAFCLMASTRLSPRWRLVFALHVAYLNLALLLSYTRAQWIASVAAVGLAILLMSRSDKTMLARSVLVLAATAVLISGLLGAEVQDTLDSTPFLGTIGDRAGSMLAPGETLESFSLEWRVFETEEGLRSIGSHPILGVGLGNAYRDVTLLHGEASRVYSRLVRYSHNSYLYIAIKMGVVGIAAFLWFYAAVLIGGWRRLTRFGDDWRRQVLIAVLASLAGLLIWSFYHAHFIDAPSTSTVGILAGVIAILKNEEVSRDGA